MIDTFTLTLGDQQVELHLDADTALAIGDKFGGLFPAFDAVKAMNIAGVAEIIRLGTKSPVVDTKDIRDRVFTAGLSNVAGPVSDYLARMINGGQEP